MLSNTSSVPAVFSWEVIDQSYECVEEAVKASYGAVSLSSEIPRIQLSVSVNKGKAAPTRPATCPQTRPGLIPSSGKEVSMFVMIVNIFFNIEPINIVQSINTEQVKSKQIGTNHFYKMMLSQIKRENSSGT